MSTEIKENDDSRSPKNIALKIRQGSNVISPIDLTLEMAEHLDAGQLQWINFYEPPTKLTLRNSGDTVMIQGRWPYHRPTLSGGPLDGLYVFNQAHFHWDSPNHEHNRHTINKKLNCLEMHALFYKSSYQSLAKAQEKDDGVLIVVYFFKVKNRSSFKWMTDQLEEVKSVKSTCQLPPAPLCSLMVPFTKDYLVYWGTLPCTCHHVLWMVSRTTLRITTEELAKFSTLQSDSRGENNSNGFETVEARHKTYQINSSSDDQELLYPNAVDPPCQITTRPNKIIIAVAYHLENTKITGKTTLNGEPSCGDFVQKPTFQEKDISESDFEFRKIPQSDENPSNIQPICSVCKMSAVNSDIFSRSHHKFPRNRYIFVSKGNIFEKEKIASAKKIKLLEKERDKYQRKTKHLYLERKESATARRMFEEERNNILIVKQALVDELEKLKVRNETKQTTPEDSGVADSGPKQLKGPINKSVLTTKPNSALRKQSNLQSEKESPEKNSKLLSKREGELSLKSETTKQHGSAKEKKDNKEKVEQTKSKTKLPVIKFAPYRPQGLQSSLTPYFQSSKPKQASESRPGTAESIVKISTQIPKYNKGKANKTVNTQRQDLQGKGDHPVNNPKRTKIKPVGHIFSSGIHYL